MPVPHVMTYRISTGLLLVLAATAILLAWFASVFLRDAAYADFAATAHRGRWLAGLPRAAVAATFGGLALLVAVLALLQVRAARAGRELAVVDDAGVSHTGFLGGTRRLAWDQIDKAEYQSAAVTFRRARGADGPRRISVPMASQDRAAFQAAVRARRPGLAPPG